MSEFEPTSKEMGLDPSELNGDENVDQISTGEREIKLENGESIKFPTIEVGRMRLFVGKGEAGLTEIPEAEETTVGDGVYLTSQQSAAEGYALRRAETNGTPTVYEAEIQNLRLLDLTTQEAQEKFTRYWKEQLLKWKERQPSKKWSPQEYAADQILLKISSKNISGMRDITFNFTSLVRDTLTREGFDGLTIEEGGEGWGEAKIGAHDSYVIFDPQAVKLIKETIV